VRPNEWGKFVDLKGSPGQQIVVGGAGGGGRGVQLGTWRLVTTMAFRDAADNICA
jgi:hypothetical protein